MLEKLSFKEKTGRWLHILYSYRDWIPGLPLGWILGITASRPLPDAQALGLYANYIFSPFYSQHKLKQNNILDATFHCKIDLFSKYILNIKYLYINIPEVYVNITAPVGKLSRLVLLSFYEIIMELRTNISNPKPMVLAIPHICHEKVGSLLKAGIWEWLLLHFFHQWIKCSWHCYNSV